MIYGADFCASYAWKYTQERSYQRSVNTKVMYNGEFTIRLKIPRTVLTPIQRTRTRGSTPSTGLTSILVGEATGNIVSIMMTSNVMSPVVMIWTLNRARSSPSMATISMKTKAFRRPTATRLETTHSTCSVCISKRSMTTGWNYIQKLCLPAPWPPPVVLQLPRVHQFPQVLRPPVPPPLLRNREPLSAHQRKLIPGLVERLADTT